MAKKKKEPVVIQQTELIPTTIGVTSSKETGPWIVIVIIALFLVGILFLDDIREFIETGGSPTMEPSVGQKPVETPKEESTPSESQEIKYYEFSQQDVLKIDQFEMNEVTLKNQQLSFQIKNNGGETDYFLTHDYYIELYDQNRTLLERLKIQKNISQVETFTYETNSKAYFYSIRLMTLDDYPAVILKKSKGISYLKCQKEDSLYTYFFDSESKLTDVEYLLQSKNDTLWEKYADLAEIYQQMEGVEAQVYDTETGFDYEVKISLEEISETNYRKFSENEYFPKQTLAKKISFELKNSGYTCE